MTERERETNEWANRDAIKMLFFVKHRINIVSWMSSLSCLPIERVLPATKQRRYFIYIYFRHIHMQLIPLWKLNVILENIDSFDDAINNITVSPHKICIIFIDHIIDLYTFNAVLSLCCTIICSFIISPLFHTIYSISSWLRCANFKRFSLSFSLHLSLFLMHFPDNFTATTQF